jgi:hypothetical protein
VNLQEVFSGINKKFSVMRDVNLGDDIITLVPLTAEEESKVLEASRELDGNMYLTGFKMHTLAYSIRKVNGIELPEQIEIQDETGKPSKTDRHLYFTKILETWPSSPRDLLYEAYTDLLTELETKVLEVTKFKRFNVAKSSESAGEEIVNAPAGFTRVDVPKEDMTEAEQLTARVKKEQEEVEISIASKEQDAIRRATR